MTGQRLSCSLLAMFLYLFLVEPKGVLTQHFDAYKLIWSSYSHVEMPNSNYQWQALPGSWLKLILVPMGQTKTQNSCEIGAIATSVTHMIAHDNSASWGWSSKWFTAQTAMASTYTSSETIRFTGRVQQEPLWYLLALASLWTVQKLERKLTRMNGSTSSWPVSPMLRFIS